MILSSSMISHIFYSVEIPKCNFTIKTMFIYLQFHTLASKNLCEQCAWFWVTSSASLGLTVESAAGKERRRKSIKIASVLCSSNSKHFWLFPKLGIRLVKKLIIALPWRFLWYRTADHSLSSTALEVFMFPFVLLDCRL